MTDGRQGSEHGSRRGVDRRTVLRTSALAAGLVWSRPVVRTIALQGATGTPEPATTSPTTATPPPTIVALIASQCRGLAPSEMIALVRGLEPSTLYAFHLHVAFTNGQQLDRVSSFTTDGDGNGDMGTFDAHTGFTATLVIWVDTTNNLVQDADEATVFSGSLVLAAPCITGFFQPD
jgi:hypothetical protein